MTKQQLMEKLQTIGGILAVIILAPIFVIVGLLLFVFVAATWYAFAGFALAGFICVLIYILWKEATEEQSNAKQKQHE